MHTNLDSQNPLFPTASAADECATAAEIYDCGKKKAPEMTSAIQENIQNSAAAAPVGVGKQFYNKCLLFPKMNDD